MSVLYIVSGNSLEDFYNDTMSYLFYTYHNHAPETEDFQLSEDDQMMASFAESYPIRNPNQQPQARVIPKGKRVL